MDRSGSATASGLGCHPHNRALRSERGQGLVEYALGLVLVSMVATVSLALVGPAVSDVYCEAIYALDPSLDCGGWTGLGAITKAKVKYKAKNQELSIKATAPDGCTEDLMVQGFGPLPRKGSGQKFKGTFTVDPPPTQVVIGSSGCGWDTIQLP